MANRKLPSDAFEIYFALGDRRSLAAVAEKLGVSKRTVSRRASEEKWSERIVEIEKKARVHVEEHAVESLAAMRTRHIKILEAMQRKALETLRQVPMQSAYQAVRTLVATIEQERLARGEPIDAATINVEAVIKREYERWLVPAESSAADRRKDEP